MTKDNSEKWLAGLKTYLFAGAAVIFCFVTLWFGPLRENVTFAAQVIQVVEGIVLFVAGKAVASKAVDVAKRYAPGAAG